MSVVQTSNLYSNSTSYNVPVTFATSGGVQNGSLCKAWVNMNGQGTVAIRADFNVTSVTDFGVGDYGVNFTNAITASYAVKVCNAYGPSGNTSCVVDLNSYGTTAFRMSTFIATISNYDTNILTAVVYR